MASTPPVNPAAPALVVVRLVCLTGTETQLAISAGEPAHALVSMYASAARTLLRQTSDLEDAGIPEQFRGVSVLRKCMSSIELVWQTAALEESIVPRLCQADSEDRVVTVIVRALSRSPIAPPDAPLMRRMFFIWSRDIPPPLVASSSESE
jgi:hypothetical protein